MEDTMIEVCYFCENTAEYNDLVATGEEFDIAGVCKKHVKNYIEGS